MEKIKYVVYECDECGFERAYRLDDRPTTCPACGARGKMKRV